MSRWIVVDNSDSKVQYTGSWSSISSAAYDKKGNFGKPYSNTLHSTTAGQASFSYTFQGSQGRIFGTTDIKTTNGVRDPTWECKVDDTVITLPTPFAYPENNWVLCSWDENTAPPGTHTVTVTAKSNGQAFLFDNFRYAPSTGVNVENADISVPFTDSNIQYGSGWQNLGTISKMAVDAGAVLTFPFYDMFVTMKSTGTGITWMGTTPTELPHGSTTAEYSIDSQSTTTFTLAGNPGSSTLYFQQIFEVGGLSLGHHTLVVTSRGKTSLTPLVLNNFIIHGGSSQEPTDSNTGTTSGSTGASSGSGSADSNQNAGNNGSSTITIISSGTKQISTIVVSSTLTGISTTGSRSAASGSPTDGAVDGKTFGTSDANSSNSSGNKKPLGSIIGGAVGGILLILLILALLVCYRRRKRNTMKPSYPRHATSEFGYTEQVQPFFTDDVPTTSYRHPGPTDQGLHNQQMEHRGNTKLARMISTSNSTSNSSTTNPPTSPTPFLGWNTHGHPSNSSPSDLGSVAGSSELLLRPNTMSSKSREASRESIQTGSSAPIIVNHEDSGYRIPQPEVIPSPPSAGIIEYPPMYTPA